MNKSIHTYSKPVELEVEYKYDQDYNKVYNLKKLRRSFKRLADTLK